MRGFVKYWRPAMAWQYFTVCMFDFLLAPFAWSVFEALSGVPVTQWQPITLHSGGLYHLSMGAVIGVSAWTRTLEKIEIMKRITDYNNQDPDSISVETSDDPDTGSEDLTPKYELNQNPRE